jgi:ATP-dependent DNA helicase
MKLEGEKIEVVPNTMEGKMNVLSDEDLNLLLDRSPEVFEGRGEGWAKGIGGGSAAAGASTASTGARGGKNPARVNVAGKGATKKGGAAFEVYVPAKDVGNDALAKMMDDDEPVTAEE